MSFLVTRPQPVARFVTSDVMQTPPHDAPADSQISPGQPHPVDSIAKDMLAAFDAEERANQRDELLSPSKRVIGKKPSPPIAQLTCAKCKLIKDAESSACGSASREFICKACNTKRSTLSQLFGKWPVEHFASLPEDHQIAFWRAETRGKQQIKDALAEQVTEHRETVEKTTTGGTYLPMSVLEKQGFDPEAVALCEDKEDHPLLGETFNLNLKQTSREEIKKQVWDDLFDVQKYDAKKEKNKKKKKSKKGKKSSSSGSNSSGSSSTDADPKQSAAEKRKAEAAKRKAEAQAAKEAIKIRKMEEAAIQKKQKEDDLRALKEAKEKQTAAMTAQTSYSNLLNAVVKLQNDVAAVPREKRNGEEYATAMEKVQEGEDLLEQCLAAMKDKTSFPVEEAKAYIASGKPVSSALKKMKKAKK